MRTASRSFTRSFTRSSPSSRSLSSKYCSSESTKPARSSGGPGVPSAAATGAGVAWGACAAGLGKAGRPPLLARRRRRGRRALALTKAVSALLVAWAAVAAGCSCSAAASGKQAASPTCLSCQCCCDSLRARDASARGTRVEGCRGEPPVWACRLPGACRLCTWRGKVYCSSRDVRFPPSMRRPLECWSGANPFGSRRCCSGSGWSNICWSGAPALRGASSRSGVLGFWRILQNTCSWPYIRGMATGHLTVADDYVL